MRPISTSADRADSGTHFFTGDYLIASALGDGLVELCLDRRDEPVNKLDAGFIVELGLVLPLLQQPTVKGVLLSSAKAAFLAGADLQVLLALCERPATELAAFSRDNGRILTALASLPVPVVAAINGYALGGGLEVALCADFRVLAEDGQVGLPEVGFGIIPGWGGTVRLPRLAGGAVALEWVVGAKPQRAAAALAAGVVDALAEPAALRDTALAWLSRAAAGELDWQARRQRGQGGFALDPAALAQARDHAQRTARHYPAPLAAVALLARCAPLDAEAALSQESACFAELAKSHTARALVGVFLTNQQMKKGSRASAIGGAPVTRVAVLGAGIMGGGIAYTSALAGIPVALKDIAQPPLDRGLAEARSLLEKQVRGGRLTAERADVVAASITPTLHCDSTFDGLGLVIEAIVENLEIKRASFAEVEAAVADDTVLASNTSSLRIADIATALQRPQRLVGLHFFNPVPLMPLVEVIRGPSTSPQALATAVGYVNAIGKMPLVVTDCAGFLVNRLLAAYFTAFQQLLRDGVDYAAIDQVMEAWGWPMGPAYLMDVAGLDTLDKALVVLRKAYPAVLGCEWRTAVELLAAEGRYGQKNGAGFYRYQPDERGRPVRRHDPESAALIASIQPSGRHDITAAEIEERLLLAMVLEAARCLQEQVVGSAAELDTAMRLATGFPAHHGGPLWYADTQGLATVRARCNLYRALGGLYGVPALLDELIGAGRRFHDAPAT